MKTHAGQRPHGGFLSPDGPDWRDSSLGLVWVRTDTVTAQKCKERGQNEIKMNQLPDGDSLHTEEQRDGADATEQRQEVVNL